MIEPDQIEFHAVTRSMPVRVGIVAGSAVLFIVGAVAAMGASPSPATSTPITGTGTASVLGVAPDDSAAQGGPPAALGLGLGLGRPEGVRGLGRLHDITIQAINGSQLTLKTDDGWSRTIAVGSSTTLQKSGQTIALSDLKVGDQIVFGESKASDGTFTINAIRVVLPVLAGRVTAVSGDTITVTAPGNTTGTIHVSASTTFNVDGNKSAKLSDVSVGLFAAAEGSLRSDGSLDATLVHAGSRNGPGRGRGGPLFRGDSDDQGNPGAEPNATPTPPTSAG